MVVASNKSFKKLWSVHSSLMLSLLAVNFGSVFALIVSLDTSNLISSGEKILIIT